MHLPRPEARSFETTNPVPRNLGTYPCRLISKPSPRQSPTTRTDGRSTCADEQRPPSPTDSVKTLVYDAYEHGYTSPGGSPYRHVKLEPCGDAADPFELNLSMQAYIEAITPPITDDSDGRSTCADSDEQRPPSPTDSVKTLVYDAYEHGYTSPGGSPYRHVKPCGDAADPFELIKLTIRNKQPI